jgi:two-component system, OmpR family, response regulator RpaB
MSRRSALILCNDRRWMLKEKVMTTNSLLPMPARPTIDLRQREIRHPAGPRHKLSRLESALLSCLLGHAGRPVSRGELLAGVWRLDPLRTMTRTVDMHISMLRRKLGDDSRRPALLLTVHRVGYMMRPVADTATR